MTGQKIVVPDGMLRAVMDTYLYGNKDAADPNREFPTYLIEAALRWLAENPVAPTTAQLAEMLGFEWSAATCEGTVTGETLARLLQKWQRRASLIIERRNQTRQ